MPIGVNPVQVIANASASSAAKVVTIAASAAGNLLRVGLSSDGNATILSVTDNLGQTWVVASAGGQKLHEVYCPNTLANVTTITITFTVAQLSIWFASEDSGVALTNPLDKIVAQTTQSGVTTWTTSSTGVLAQAAELGYAYAYSVISGDQFPGAGLGSGWAVVTGTGITNSSRNSGSGECMTMIRKIYAATTADTGSAGCVIGANPFNAMATYKEVAAAPGGGVANNDRLGIKLGIGI